MSSIQLQQQEHEINSHNQWYYSKTFVWILLLSIGPIGLPWLFKSPKFSLTSKWIITILIVIVTLFPLYMGYAFNQLLKNPEEFEKLLNMFLNHQDSQLIIDFLKLLNH